MDILVLALFCVILLLSMIFDFSLLLALFLGLLLFAGYAAYLKFTPTEIFEMIRGGIWKSRNMFVFYALIGIMTALWRAAGTIPTIVSYSAGFLEPRILILMCFLLNSLASFLMGTSFGTGATMGVICASVTNALGVNPVLAGGAILAGAYFGDRCSPVSASMLLIANITETDPHKNMRNMFRTAAIPFALSCIVYLVMGLVSGSSGDIPDLTDTFSQEFTIHPVALLPAAAILVLALFHVKAKLTMLVSILISLPIAMFLQGKSFLSLLEFSLLGYTANHADVAALVNGGGIRFMVRVAVIVAISSAYAGIFEKTKLLTCIQKYICILAKKTTLCVSMLFTSLLISMAVCNQTLAIMLTQQLCQDLSSDRDRFVTWLEDTAVVVAAWIPWNVASTTILSSCGMTSSSILAAVYLFFLPLFAVLFSFKKKS